ncbi:MAG: aryl sulfotransferase, partial [Rhodobacteraceae bacterium]|nr:aryl sulfotransferase [Paracoccaceae bacterium]
MPDAAQDLPNQITMCRRQIGLTAHDPANSAGGYTLYARQTGGGIVDMVNMEGQKVHQWDMP